MSREERKEKFLRWLDGGVDLTDAFPDEERFPDPPREELKREEKTAHRAIVGEKKVRAFMNREKRGFRTLYRVVAVVSCILLIGVLLYLVASLPISGEENPETRKVVERYVRSGVEETGAVNIVAGMILDYRAFDTLGESHVLFTALVCVMILLAADQKNMSPVREDYYLIRTERYYDLSGDSIVRTVGSVLVPAIFVFGAYVVLNGQNGPGGGFSGGAVMGAALILSSAAFGFGRVDRVFTARKIQWIAFIALSFYSFAKGYVFFMGANGLDNHIPKGIPGADPAARHRGRTRCLLHDVRLLQSVPAGKDRRLMMEPFHKRNVSGTFLAEAEMPETSRGRHRVHFSEEVRRRRNRYADASGGKL